MEGRKELVEKAKKGDVSAFSALYEEVYQDLYRFALYTLKNTHDAEDVVSDTVTDAWQEICGLRKAEAFRGWIFRILSNKCKQKLKKYTEKMVEIPENITAPENDLCQDMDVRRAFAALSDEERLILSWNIFGGYSSREIGRELNLSDGTVRSKQSRALKKMERKLKR